MGDSILKKQGANFYGFERIDSTGKHRYDLFAVRGNGDLLLTKNEIVFNQWMLGKAYTISLDQITRVDIKIGHNLKMKWPGKVLRIYFKEGNEIKIFGIALGGMLSIRKGWQDDAYVWKEKIESLING